MCKACGTAIGGVPAGGANDFARRLFSTESLVMAIALGLTGMLISTAGAGAIIVRVLYSSAVVGYYFNVIQHVGGGTPGMPGPADALDDLPTMLGRSVRGILVFGVSLVPLLVWLFGYHHWRTVEREWTTALAMLVIGQLYMPAVLLSVTFGDSALNALWPPAWIQIVARAPGSYAAFTALWVVTIFIGGAVVGGLQAAVELVPYAGVAVSATIAMMFWFAQAILVGLFIRRNADAFGWA